MNDTLIAIGKTVLGAAAVAPALTHQPPEVAASFLAVPEELIEVICLFGACVGGAYASFGWGEPVEPRRAMFRLFTSCIIMGFGFTLMLNWGVEWWTKTSGLTLGAKAGIGVVVSCLTRFVMPKVVQSINDGSWRDLVPFLNRKKVP